MHDETSTLTLPNTYDPGDARHFGLVLRGSRGHKFIVASGCRMLACWGCRKENDLQPSNAASVRHGIRGRSHDGSYFGSTRRFHTFHPAIPPSRGPNNANEEGPTRVIDPVCTLS